MKQTTIGRWVLLAALPGLLLPLPSALAQSDDVERGLQRRPGLENERPELPEFDEREDVPLDLPAIESLAIPKDTLSGAPLVYLQKVQLTDATELTATDVGEVSAAYLDRNVSAEELQQLRAELTQLYVDRGYITSGVLLPDQRISDGTVRYQAVEGRLEALEVSTSGRLRPSYVESRLQGGGDEPLNVVDLREQLRILHADPLIERVDSRLLPTQQRGSARLVVDVEEARPYSLFLTAHNNRAPSVGSEWVELGFVHRNLLGFGDRAELRYGTGDGLDDYQLGYAVPVTRSGITVGVSYAQSDAQIVEEPFSRIDIRSDSEEWALDVVVPWKRFGARRLTFIAGVDHRESNTSLLGIPFSFSPGVNNGRAEVTAARLTADWTDRRANQVFALRGRISVGLDALDSTINDGNLPDSEFVTFLGQAQWSRRFGENDNQLILRGDLQKTFDGLLPLEKLSIGGRTSVRGYRQNLMVRDNGWVASAEFRMPAFRDSNGRSKFQWSVFADIGRGWNEDFDTPEPKSIASVGAGFLWDPLPGLHTELYLAHGFEDIEFSDSDPQDDGIHLLVRYDIF
ncbi:MAG: ShlB/FhaC/HecB family hemolysin secretion/activation protein [Pseudomonadota bacterium]